MKIVLAAINAKYIHANLAIYSLRAFSDEYKEQIQIKEYTINQYTEDILADLYKEQADMVAFSCYIWNMGMVEELAELLQKIYNNQPHRTEYKTEIYRLNLSIYQIGRASCRERV